MGRMGNWLVSHTFELLQIVLVSGGFLATLYTLREDKNERKIQNLFSLNAAHREIWSALYDRPQLARVLESSINLANEPITSEERLFVNFLILHLRASFKARQSGMEFDDDDMAADIRQFFAHPIPRQIWEGAKKFQDLAFTRFVESNLR